MQRQEQETAADVPLPAPLSAPPVPGLARSAGLLALGSAASRVLGLLREVVIATYFGASGLVDAFRVAAQVPVLLYDFLVGGMLSAALVPVLSQYSRLRSQREFGYLVSTLATLFALSLTLLLLLLEISAPQVARLLAGGLDEFDATLLPLTTQLIRLTAPTVWLLSMAGLATAVLYARQRFSYPALATAVYNLGMVIAAPLLAHELGIVALVVGMVGGALAQLAVMVFDLHQAGLRLVPRLDWRHPALAQIMRLYLPIAAGLVVTLFQVGLDRRLASSTGLGSIAWMSYATTLQQMPLGLISVAISLAALPRLSQFYAEGDEAGYRATLGRGLRLVLLLIVPAALLLWILGESLTRLLFQHAAFTPADTAHVVAALNIYIVGMLFAALDYPLNFAFYARNNTWLPALVGVISVGVYVVVALALVKEWGYLGLVWADTAKQMSHALIMLMLAAWQIRIGPGSHASSLVWIGGAALALTLVTWLMAQGVNYWLAAGWLRDLGVLLLAGGAGILAYAVMLRWGGVAELATMQSLIRQRMGRC